MPKLEISFTIVPIPDSTGLRIKSDTPTGVYVSSFDALAARYYFVTTLMQLIRKRRLLEPRAGESLALAHAIDWDGAVEAGSGRCTARIADRAETMKMMRGGEPVISPPGSGLVTNWWRNPLFHEICVVRDHGELVDGWLLRSIKADFLKQPQE